MNDVQRPRWAWLAALGIAAGAVALVSPSPAPAAEPAQVQMVDNEPDLTNWHYDPAEITVPAGATVVWVNRGNEEHTVTSDPKSPEKFDSGYKKKGASWQRAFSRPGRFSYYCAPHPWMKGTVVVLAAATAAAPPAGDTASSTTTAPPAATSSTFPPSLAAPTTEPPNTATTAPAESSSTAPAEEGVEEPSAAPASSEKGSGSNLAGTLAIVLLPTLGGLALGARLRRSKAG